MNLSKKLLLALAGHGLMVPMAASAQELASLNGAAAFNDYMQQQDIDSSNQVNNKDLWAGVIQTQFRF